MMQGHVEQLTDGNDVLCCSGRTAPLHKTAMRQDDSLYTVMTWQSVNVIRLMPDTWAFTTKTDPISATSTPYARHHTVPLQC